MKFKVGDEVAKQGGDYKFDGHVVAAFTKRSGAERYVVEDDRGILHVYSEKNLEFKWQGFNADEVLKTLARGVAIYVVNEDNNILVSYRTGTSSFSGFLQCPGGTVEPNENTDAAVLRELQEETGIMETDLLGPITYLGSTWGLTKPDGTSYAMAYYTCKVRNDQRVVNREPDKSGAWMWLPIEEIVKSKTMPNMLRFMPKPPGYKGPIVEVSCVWCGLKFDSLVQSQAQHLYDHAKTCPKHPVSKLVSTLEQHRRIITRLVEDNDFHEDGCPEDDTCQCPLVKEINSVMKLEV